MERLTKWNDKTEGAELISWDEEEWKDFMGSLDVPICTELSLAVDKLAEYEDAEEQGLLLRLPCKVGDKVFYIVKNEISEFIITSFTSDTKELYCNWKYNKGRYTILLGFLSKEIGKTVFLTKEEAEQALARMEGENE